jgi:hypothetical protein
MKLVIYPPCFRDIDGRKLVVKTVNSDVIEEFIAAEVWPISAGWQPASIISLTMDWAAQQVPFPRFNL